MSRLHLVLVVAACAAGLPSAAAAQDHWLRDRLKGEWALPPVICFCAPVGLKEIVELTQLTVEGVVSRADSALAPDEDRLDTDYVIDVTRVFRIAPVLFGRGTPEATHPLPFIAASPASRASASPVQVRVRAFNHGRFACKGGGVVTQFGEFRMLAPGEHVIVSAYFDGDVGQWRPFGVFTVRDGRVIHMESRVHVPDYESVAQFASALANPPPAPQR
jgi:hypothetical protein